LLISIEGWRLVEAPSVCEIDVPAGFLKTNRDRPAPFDRSGVADAQGHHRGQEIDMQPAGPNELGYANTALILGLFHVLVSKGALTRDDLDVIVTDAISELDRTRNTSSVSGAIDFIKSLLPEIREHEA
jgi:hypothetical protein